MRRSALRVALLVVPVSLAIAACGRPATRADCDRIITKAAQLKAKEEQQADPDLIQKAIEDYKRDHADDIEKNCVGKSLSDRALACIDRADSTAAVENCLY